MQMTTIERLMIWNQYEILRFLDPENRDSYEQRQNLIEHGFEFEFDSLVRHLCPESQMMTEDESREVLDILSMYRALGDFTGRGGELPESPLLKFFGFDGNHESNQLGYVRYLIQTGRFTEQADAGDGLNSHHPTLPIYRRLLGAWKQSADRYQLSDDDVARIAAAAQSPQA